MLKLILTIIFGSALIIALIARVAIKVGKWDVSKWDRVPKDTKSMEERIKEYDEYLASNSSYESEVFEAYENEYDKYDEYNEES